MLFFFCLWQFEGPIQVLYCMMVDPNANIKKGSGKDLTVVKGEILEVIQQTNEKKVLCRNDQGKCTCWAPSCEKLCYAVIIMVLDIIIHTWQTITISYKWVIKHKKSIYFIHKNITPYTVVFFFLIFSDGYVPRHYLLHEYETFCSHYHHNNSLIILMILFIAYMIHSQC